MANYASQASSIQIQALLQASLAVTGQAFTAPSVNDSIAKKVSYSTTQGNTTASGNTTGSDEAYAAITSIAPSGTATLDLTNLTDLFGQTLNFARVKGIVVWLLSTTDDPTVVTGASLAASQITVGAAGISPFSLPVGTPATHTWVVKNGETQCWVSPSGTGITVDGTHKNLQVVNNDASNTAKVLIVLMGGTS